MKDTFRNLGGGKGGKREQGFRTILKRGTAAWVSGPAAVAVVVGGGGGGQRVRGDGGQRASHLVHEHFRSLGGRVERVECINSRGTGPFKGEAQQLVLLEQLLA